MLMTLGGGDVPAGTGAFSGSASAGTSPRLLPGECRTGRGALQGTRDTVVTGQRYLGCFIGDADTERDWLQEKKIQVWLESAKVLAWVAHKHPQSAYAGLKKSLQQEWYFVQRVTSGVGGAFGPVEEALREIFVLELFEGLR